MTISRSGRRRGSLAHTLVVHGIAAGDPVRGCRDRAAHRRRTPAAASSVVNTLVPAAPAGREAAIAMGRPGPLLRLVGWSMLDGESVSTVLDVLRPERAALIDLLKGLGAAQWDAQTECPTYTVNGIATHVLGDDLSLLSRQRDSARSGLAVLAGEMPGADIRVLLDTFNDRWVASARFLSHRLLVELLQLAGEWSAAYYEQVDPNSAGERVAFFGGEGRSSPYWQVIAREYIERWVHHSQIRRAVGLPSLAEPTFLVPGMYILAAVRAEEAGIPSESGGEWKLGQVVLGPAEQAADILTRAHTADRVRKLLRGPADAVESLATFTGRP
jgi:uncharacterized protein (TIGR03083 family)